MKRSVSDAKRPLLHGTQTEQSTAQIIAKEGQEKPHMKNDKKYQKDLEDSMQNAVRVYDWYMVNQKMAPKESDDYGLYKYGEWIVKNML